MSFLIRTKGFHRNTVKSHTHLEERSALVHTESKLNEHYSDSGCPSEYTFIF